MSVKSSLADSHVRISANVLERIPEIGSHGFTLYAVIKNHENRATGRCFPSLKRLVQLTAFDKKTVIKYIRLLESSGLIDIRPSWSGTRRTSNQYDFIEFWNSDETDSVQYPWQDAVADEGSGDDPPPLQVEEIPSPYGRVPLEPADLKPDLLTSQDISVIPIDEKTEEQPTNTQDNTSVSDTPELTIKQANCSHPKSMIYRPVEGYAFCGLCYADWEEGTTPIENV